MLKVDGGKSVVVVGYKSGTTFQVTNVGSVLTDMKEHYGTVEVCRKILHVHTHPSGSYIPSPGDTNQDNIFPGYILLPWNQLEEIKTGSKSL